MSLNLTNAEWQEIISQAQKSIQSSDINDTSIASQFSGQISRCIDHTLLKLDATESQIDALCQEALAENFATVCVRQKFVARAKSALKGSDVGIACVVGFHEGTQSTESKVEEARCAIEDGASELDAVLNRGLLKEGKYDAVFEELSAIREVASHPVLMKVILETSQLDRDEVIAACLVAGYAGVDFVKTSTGFCGRGASLEDVQLMGAVAGWLYEKGVGPKDGSGKVVRMSVKAAGGVKGFEDAVKMVEAGASRIGTSSGTKIVQREREGLNRKEKSTGGDVDKTNGPNGY